MIHILEKRKSRIRFGALLLASALVLLLASSAAAVDAPIYNTGLFELETGNNPGSNAETDAADPNLPDDWDRVCRKVDGGTAAECGTDVQAHTEDVAFVTEATGESIFTGGGSKDDLDINKWKWKNGSVPDKDELLHAFAARYTCTVVSSCDPGDRYLFFGADRFDNSGDAQIGFWFLQGDVAPQGSGGGGGSPFGPDKHVIGDLLVLSDFTNGGTKPTIRVFMWDPSHTPASELVDGTLLPLAGGLASAECGAAGTADFCANVNQPAEGSLTNAPWDFLDKSGNTDFARGELYEGGVNLTDIGAATGINLAGECFASFFAETRSAQSVDAVLKDFAGGEFQPCESSINTVPSVSTIAVGGSVTDTATVTGTGAGTPTGKVKFWVCSPTQLDDPVDPADDAALCDVGGTFIDVGADEPDGETLTPVDATTATATSDAVTVNVVGTWCFRGVYEPAIGSPYPAATDFDASECFEVTPLQPGITTAQTWTVKDSATITVSSGGGDIEGTLRFRLFTTNDCTGTTLVDESFNVDSAGALSVTKDTTPVTITSSKPILKWLVEFDSSNDNHNDVTSACGTENSVLSITNG